MKIVLLVCLLQIMNCYSNDKKYSFADLQALQKSGNWAELLQHIEDISPSKRDVTWTEMLTVGIDRGFDEFLKDGYSYNLSYFVERFMDKYPEARKNKNLSLKVAKNVRKRISNTKAIKYFEWALAGKPSEKNCQDEDLKLSLISSLNLPSKNSKSLIAKRVAFGSCFSFLKKSIITAMKSGSNGLQNSCQGMLDKKALKGISKKKCLRLLKKGKT